jgi:hypothetical protein
MKMADEETQGQVGRYDDREIGGQKITGYGEK